MRDGRRVVVKVHRARVSAAFLSAVQVVQRHLVADGFPAPSPLAGPERLSRGVATVETLLDDGEPPDGHDPQVRRALAVGLARLTGRCRTLAPLDGLLDNPMAVAAGALWPQPHDLRFDFTATRHGAEWIDEIARRARRVRDSGAGDTVVGHIDWRVENVRMKNGRLSAVYDWDSLVIAREPVVVGSVAHGFTANWATPNQAQFPTLEEAFLFVSDYEDARGVTFRGEELAAARASLVYTMAYTARCEHSDALTDMGRRVPVPTVSEPAPPQTARGFLAAHAAELLGG